MELDETLAKVRLSKQHFYAVICILSRLFCHIFNAFILQELLRVGCKRPLKVEHVNVSTIQVQTCRLVTTKLNVATRYEHF